jgi:hypothetical protein
MKDFCTFSKSHGRRSTEWGVRWLTSINNDANMLANFVSHSSAAKVLLSSECLQREVDGAPRAIAVSAPPRFATNFFVMQGVQRNKVELLQACSDDAWTDLGGKLVVPLLSPVHTAAYLLDPLHSLSAVASPTPRKCQWITRRQRGSSLSVWMALLLVSSFSP